MIAFDALMRIENMLIDTRGIAEALVIIGLSDEGRGAQDALCFLARQLHAKHRDGSQAFNEVFDAVKSLSDRLAPG